LTVIPEEEEGEEELNCK